MRYRAIMAAWFLGVVLTTTASAQEPGWYGRIVTFGAERRTIEETPILQRSYRPFHFYGNTVRRLHYRGTALPSVGDFRDGTTAVFSVR